jgi:hypothetical protein
MQRFFSGASQNRDPGFLSSEPPGPRLCSAPLREELRHSASKTRVNALMALRPGHGNYFIRLNRTLLPSASRVAM